MSSPRGDSSARAGRHSDPPPQAGEGVAPQPVKQTFTRERGRVGWGQTAIVAKIEIGLHYAAWCRALPDVEALIETAARSTLAAAAPKAAAPVLGVILSDDAEQRRLNRTWRGRDAPTNVLSFPALSPDMPSLPPGAPLLLGDVVLAYETVAREAAEQRKPLADHLRHLVVHGVLHLLGFDHENDTEAAIMEAREVAILARMGVPDPYRDPI